MHSSNLLLFTTPSCPHCPTAIKLLQDAKIPCTFLDATKHTKLVRKYCIMKAPTLVVETKHEVQTYLGIDGITRYIQERKKLVVSKSLKK